MKRPKNIKVSNRTVTIEWDVPLGRLSEGYARAGDHAKGKIRVSRGNTPRSNRNVVFHEVGHEVWQESGLDQFLSTKTEELVLDSLFPWLWLVLAENPDLRQYLFEDVDE